MNLTKEMTSFIEFAQKKWRCLDNGDSKMANKYYDKLNRITKFLLESNRIKELEVLLNNENDSAVRLEASCKLLILGNQRAEMTLKELTVLKGLIGFTAKMTLKEWEKGNLK